MREPVMIDWRVPKRPWKMFRDDVESEFGGIEGYLARKAMDAMDEFAEADGYETVEDHVDRLVRAAGRTPADRPQEKNNSSAAGSDLGGLETTRVTIRVDERVKERFKNAADESAFDTYGVAFGRALELYCDGGRAARMEDKLERVVEDAESLLSQLDEAEAENGLGVKERKTIVICNRLGDQFTDEELVSEIHEVAATGPRASPQTIEKYREMVTDRLDVEPHPMAESNPYAGGRVWIPAAEAEDLAPDGEPKECRLPVDLLDESARIRRILLSIGKRAAETGAGKARLTVEDVYEDVLDEEGSKKATLGLMEEAALTDGYKLTRRGDNATLHVDLNVLKNIDDEPAVDELFEEIITYRESDADDLISETTGTTMSDFTSGPDAPGQANASASSASGAATDGGGPSRDDAEDELDEFVEEWIPGDPYDE